MIFNSVLFAIFLPIVFLIYWKIKTIPRRNLWIVISSFFFYGYWDWRFLFLLLGTAMLDFFVAKKMSRIEEKEFRKKWLMVSVMGNLTVLGFFKYFNFFATSFRHLLDPDLPADYVILHIVLPVGISFYTFQALSYTIEVYRGKMKAEEDPITYLAYISFFPQLVAGPIERATHLLPQFNTPKIFNYNFAISGLRLMLWGLFKKVVIADNIAALSDGVFNHAQFQSGIISIVGVAAFSLQIYCDFSGYSDIARGCARLFGFDLMKNFNFPYFADSLRNFWQRWHISLSTWFRDYLYIPLGGSKEGEARSILNLLITFVVSGLWHGANWTFLFWGTIHGTGMIGESLLQKTSLKKTSGFLKRIFMLAFVLVAWTFFRAKTLTEANIILENIFTWKDSYRSVGTFITDVYGNGILAFAILLLCVLFIFTEFLLMKGMAEKFLQQQSFVKISSYYFLIALIFLFGVFHNAPAFIYFQF